MPLYFFKTENVDYDFHSGNMWYHIISQLLRMLYLSLSRSADYYEGGFQLINNGSLLNGNATRCYKCRNYMSQIITGEENDAYIVF